MKTFTDIENEFNKLQMQLFDMFAKDFGDIFTEARPFKVGRVTLYRKDTAWIYKFDGEDYQVQSVVHILNIPMLPPPLFHAIFSFYRELEEDESDFDQRRIQ